MALPIGDHVITGQLTGVEARGSQGWMRYSIVQPGNTYPDKVDTKKPEIINACAALMGQMVSAQITVQDSGNPNEHQPGTNYLNRYLNQIGAAGMAVPAPTQPLPAQPQQAAQQPQAQIQPPQPVRSPQQNDQVKEIRIMREVGAKVAAALLPYLPEGQQNVTGIVEVSEAVVAYFVYGPSRFGVGAFNAPAEPEPPAAPPAPPEQPQAEQPPHPAEQPSGPPIRINENVAPCDQCGAIQGEAHSTDCIPF